jgi:hypothetical protein
VVANATIVKDTTIADPAFFSSHPELHHYTNLTGLQGIFQSNALWATHFADLNDATEIRLLKAPLEDATALRFREIIRRRKRDSVRIQNRFSKMGGLLKGSRELAHDLIQTLYNTTFINPKPFAEPFITSPCTHAKQRYEQEHGLLSQWRGYGGDGGFCVVFDSQKLAELLVLEAKAHFYLHLDIVEVRYALPGISISDLFPDLMHVLDQYLLASLEGLQGTAEEVFPPFAAGATSYKHEGFKEESEVRIVAIPGSQQFLNQARSEYDKDFDAGPVKKVYTRERNSGKHRHIVLFETLKTKLPIKRVIIGPSRHQNENLDKARSMIRNTFPLSCSATPYIG